MSAHFSEAYAIKYYVLKSGTSCLICRHLAYQVISVNKNNFLILKAVAHRS